MSAKRSYFDANALPFRQPFYPNYGPNYGPNFGLMSPSWPPVNPAHSVYPRMWSSTDPYYRPQYGSGPNDHSTDCCLSTQNAEGCRQTEHNHSRCPNCEQLDSSTDDVVINDVTNESVTTAEPIDSTVEDMNRKLLDSKLSILDINERNAIETIDGLERDLKGMAQQIKLWCQRFCNNDEVRDLLMSNANEVYTALVKTNKLKEWLKSETSAKKANIMEDIKQSDGVALIQDKLASDLPLFWQICESLFKSLNVGLNAVTDEVTKQTEDKSSGMEDILEVIRKDEPNISQIEVNNSPPEDNEENDNNNNEAVENDTNSDDLTSKESIVGKKFGDDPYPTIELTYITPSAEIVAQHNVYIEPTEEVIPQHNGYMDIQQIPNMDKRRVLDMREPIPELKPIVVKPTVVEPKTNGSVFLRRPSTLKPPLVSQNLILLNSTPNPTEKYSSNENINSKSSQPTIATNGRTVSPNEPKVKVSAHTQKVLDKVKAIYPTKTEEELLVWVTASKSILVECGHTKGFSGMKISDIVSFVCEYIKNEEMSAPKDNTHSKQMSGPRNLGFEDCILCRTAIDSKHDMLSLSCKHLFHVSCLEDWAQTNTRCPKCQIPI